MTVPDGTFREANPFPFSPIVQLRVLPRERPAGATAEEAPVSIATPVWGRLWRQVEEYLEHAEEATTRGRALALIGGLGRGKSHLARQVVSEVQESGEAIPVWVIDQPGTDLTSLYRNQLTAMSENLSTRLAFERVVETYHAQVTANVLAQDDSSGLDDRTRDDFVRQLRRDQLDSRKVARSLDINEDVIHRHLRAELRGVTGHKQFAAAFALLLDRRYNSAVWSWLGGGRPERSLEERGITDPIEGVRGVLDALTVFGFLHGQVGKPYVLVVDALDEAANDQAFLGPFESLVDTFVNRGGLLVLTTLPEQWNALSRGLHERILQVWPPRMTRAETGELVAAYVRRRPARTDRTPGDDESPSFDPSGLDRLVETTDGVPRQILRVCRRAWQLADDPSTAGRGSRVIDAALIHRAVRALTELRAMADVHDEVERALAADQWPHERRPLEVGRAADPRLSQVSYWVRVGERDVVAILLVPSILDNGEIGDIEALAAAARAAFDGGCRLLVVVNGTVSRPYFNALSRRIETAPLMVGDGDLAEALRAAVGLLAERLATARQGGGVTAIWERLATMADEQTAVLGAVRRMETTLRHDDAAAVTDEEQVLPAAVADRFAAAHRALETLAQPPGRVDEVFHLDSSGRPGGDGLPSRLAFDAEQLTALGLVSAVGHLLRAFRSGVAAWQRAYDRRTDGAHPELSDSLFVLCRSFEISMEVLPTLGGTQAAGDAAGPEDADRRATARELLNRLAEGVRADLESGQPGVSEVRPPR